MPKNHNITYKNIAKFSHNFNKKRTNKVFKNANTKTNFENIVTKSDYIQNKKRVFKKFIDVKTLPTNQEKSGRCWLFAFLNIIRINMIKKYNLDNFEFSQNYLFFYHKLEEANYFLNYIYDKRAIDIKNKLNYNKENLKVINILDNLVSDGGDWKAFYGLVKKYGLIPKTTMDDHYHSKNSNELRLFLNDYLRKASLEMKNSKEKKEVLINKYLQNCYKILVFFLGEPPQKITWQYYKKLNNKNETKIQKVIENISPLNFYKKIVPYNVDNKICLINFPCKEQPFYKPYKLELAFEVLGEKEQNMINVPINVMIELCKKSIDNNDAVWCGLDWNKYRSSYQGYLDKKGFNYSDMFGFNNNIEKCDSLIFRQSLPSHAVILRGYNFEQGKTNGFLVENSHGIDWKNEFKENYYMSENWFNDFVFIIVVDKNIVNKRILKASKEKSILLPYWSPFGNLMN